MQVISFHFVRSIDPLISDLAPEKIFKKSVESYFAFLHQLGRGQYGEKFPSARSFNWNLNIRFGNFISEISQKTSKNGRDFGRKDFSDLSIAFLQKLGHSHYAKKLPRACFFYWSLYLRFGKVVLANVSEKQTKF